MKQWLTLHGSSCIKSSRLFPYSCSTFSKSSFFYKQAVGQRHQYQCQCIRVHHTIIPARMPSMENNTRINRVSDHHVSASSRPTGLRLSNVHDPVAESASKCFDFAPWHKEFDDFNLICVST